MKPQAVIVSMALIAGTPFFMGSDEASAQPRTESICNLGMVKGEEGRTCDVPIPSGCQVANFPGFDAPWVDVSKGGKTTCEIDQDQTDWKTRIVGSCGPCGTDNCSARFSVMFTCGERETFTEQPRKVYKDEER